MSSNSLPLSRRMSGRSLFKLLAAFLITALAVTLAMASAPSASASATPHATAIHKIHPRSGIAPKPIGGPLLNHGGPVENAPRVFVVYWHWVNDPHGEQAYLNNFLSSVGGTSWLSTVNQYGNAGWTGNLLAGTWSDPSAIPNTPTDANLQTEARNAAIHFGAGNSVNVEIVVATPTGHSTSGFGTQYCAYHGAVSSDPNITYTDLPYITDAGANCGENSVNAGAAGTLDGVSIVEGHELAETITDPLLNAWWDANGNEIGDKCAWFNLHNITTSRGTFAVQPLWSNRNNGCVG